MIGVFNLFHHGTSALTFSHTTFSQWNDLIINILPFQECGFNDLARNVHF